MLILEGCWVNQNALRVGQPHFSKLKIFGIKVFQFNSVPRASFPFSLALYFALFCNISEIYLVPDGTARAELATQISELMTAVPGISSPP